MSSEVSEAADGGEAGAVPADPVASVGARAAASAHDAVPAARSGGGTVWLLGSELLTLFRRLRTWAMLAALAAIPVLIGVALVIAGPAPSGRGPAFLSEITNNGLFVGVTAIIVAIPLFLPLTIGVVAGDTIAGEASHGTLRYLVIAPAGACGHGGGRSGCLGRLTGQRRTPLP